MAAGRAGAVRLLRRLQRAACRCPSHSHTYSQVPERPALRNTDYAFEMAISNIRYGEGVTKEIGMDLQNLGATKVCLMTDKNLSQLPPVNAVLDSLARYGINFQMYDNVRVEPTDQSFLDAIEFAKKGEFDAYVAVGGGSVIDTCKAANLYAASPASDFLDYVNAPIGKGKPVTVPLKPLIAVPTTTGTGSETTGVAIFDFKELKVKTGIASRAIKPTLGIIDPLHTLSMPERIVANSGFDVLCHALESYTALPYNMRSPCPSNPINRPAYQGSNPISDVWALHALRIVAKYLKRAVRNPEDREARANMHLASAFAGIGFGNAGVHLCHGMSYPISGLVKTYKPKDYNVDHSLVPHGLSVVLTSPAVFAFTAQVHPERHLEAAEILGADIRTARIKDAGFILADTLRKFLFDLNVDDGLAAIGYSKADIPALVKGTLPQVIAISDHRPHRIEKLQPHQGDLFHVLYSEDEVRGLGHLPSGQRGPCSAKGTAQHVGLTERESSKSCKHLLDGKSSFPPSPVAQVRAKAVAVTGSPTGNRTSTDDHRQRWRKTAEYDLTLPPGAEASLPLTGGSLYGTPSLLRKMWMKHKKKSEYLGATNNAFEAD